MGGGLFLCLPACFLYVQNGATEVASPLTPQADNDSDGVLPRPSKAATAIEAMAPPATARRVKFVRVIFLFFVFCCYCCSGDSVLYYGFIFWAPIFW